MRLARSAGVALGVLAVAVLLPGAALASARGAHGKDPGPGSRDGGTGTIERFPCAPEGSEGSGIWGALGPHRHDNLVVTTQAGTLQPGTTFTVALQWEWRDWRPGAPLALRVCLDADGPDAVDGESTAPLDDLGVGPIDRSFVQPDTEPALQVLTDSGEVRPVVKVPVTITIPASAPAGGELCVRGAVTGAPGDHPTSPPLFDISRTLCRPIAQALPVSSPSPVATTPPAPPVPPPSPAPPAPSLASPAPRPSRLMKRVTPKAEIPTTGAPVGPELALAVLLLGGGVTLTQMRKRRSADTDAGRSPGREG
ncbi:MAG TPA: hypothetical protein VII47_00970 [Actinomycetota bacterium]